MAFGDGNSRDHRIQSLTQHHLGRLHGPPPPGQRRELSRTLPHEAAHWDSRVSAL